jgi:hypothetical protein
MNLDPVATPTVICFGNQPGSAGSAHLVKEFSTSDVIILIKDRVTVLRVVSSSAGISACMMAFLTGTDITCHF